MSNILINCNNNVSISFHQVHNAVCRNRFKRLEKLFPWLILSMFIYLFIDGTSGNDLTSWQRNFLLLTPLSLHNHLSKTHNSGLNEAAGGHLFPHRVSTPTGNCNNPTETEQRTTALHLDVRRRWAPALVTNSSRCIRSFFLAAATAIVTAWKSSRWVEFGLERLPFAAIRQTLAGRE